MSADVETLQQALVSGPHQRIHGEAHNTLQRAHVVCQIPSEGNLMHLLSPSIEHSTAGPDACSRAFATYIIGSALPKHNKRFMTTTSTIVKSFHPAALQLTLVGLETIRPLQQSRLFVIGLPRRNVWQSFQRLLATPPSRQVPCRTASRSPSRWPCLRRPSSRIVHGSPA